MNCIADRDRIQDYLDGRLSPEENQAVENHLEQCEDCRREWLEMRNLQQLLVGLPDEDLPEGFREELHERLVGIPNIPHKNMDWWKTGNPKRNPRIWSAVAAAVVVCLAGVSAFQNIVHQPKLQASMAKEPSEAVKAAEASDTAGAKASQQAPVLTDKALKADQPGKNNEKRVAQGESNTNGAPNNPISNETAASGGGSAPLAASIMESSAYNAQGDSTVQSTEPRMMAKAFGGPIILDETAIQKDHMIVTREISFALSRPEGFAEKLILQAQDSGVSMDSGTEQGLQSKPFESGKPVQMTLLFHGTKAQLDGLIETMSKDGIMGKPQDRSEDILSKYLMNYQGLKELQNKVQQLQASQENGSTTAGTSDPLTQTEAQIDSIQTQLIQWSQAVTTEHLKIQLTWQGEKQ